MGRRALALKAIVKDGCTAVLTNQTAWFMRELVHAGSRGITKADYPGLHVGDIVMRIRRTLGYETIICEMEPNSGAWGGEHGRYSLNADITLKAIARPKQRRPATAATVQTSNLNQTNGKAGGNSDE